MRVALGTCRHNHMQAVGAVEVVAAVDIMARQLWFVCWPPANHLLCSQIVTISVPAFHLARYDTCRYANHAWLSAVEC